MQYRASTILLTTDTIGLPGYPEQPGKHHDAAAFAPRPRRCDADPVKHQRIVAGFLDPLRRLMGRKGEHGTRSASPRPFGSYDTQHP